MGSKKSSSSSTSTTNLQDQRQVVGAGSIGVGPYASYASSSYTSASSSDDNSINVDARANTDSRRWTDASVRDTGNTTVRDTGNTNTSTTVNYTGTDGATAAQIAKYNADVVRDLGDNQTDATRAVAQMTTASFDRLGGTFTDLFSTSGANMARTWEHTLDASQDVLDKAFTIAGAGAQSAAQLAGQAIATAQPADSKMADAIKYAAIGGAVLVAINLLK